MTGEAFLKELQRIINSQPKEPIHETNCEDCQWSDYIYNSRNLFQCFDTANSTDSIYLFDSFMVVNSVDCDYTVEAELCYESVDAYKCYNSNYIDSCSRLRDSSYCYGCWDGNNLFGCASLRNKSFCIFNRQFTEEEYKQEIKKYEKLPPEKILELLDQVRNSLPATQTNEGNNENSPYGNYSYENRNSYLMFDAARNENSAYLYDTFDSKMIMDATYSIHNQLTYETVDSANLFNCDFIVNSAQSHESSYLIDCFNVKSSLGCVNLKHKEFCLLNRQLTQEEYERESAVILKDLREKNLGWGSLKY